jgi:cell shape-determining protein MreC
MFIEKVVMHYFVQDSEFSTSKLIIRMLALICVVLSFLLCKSKSTKHLFTYLTGYVILSILIQYYSLLKTNNAKSAVDDVNDAVDNGAKLASQNSKKKLRIKRKKKLEEENKQLRNS